VADLREAMAHPWGVPEQAHSAGSRSSEERLMVVDDPKTIMDGSKRTLGYVTSKGMEVLAFLGRDSRS
jgi:hypothetical protein